MDAWFASSGAVALAAMVCTIVSLWGLQVPLAGYWARASQPAA